MSKLLDINSWLALLLEGHSQHAVARAWYESEDLLASDLNFCRPTEMGLLRLLTQTKVMQACLSQHKVMNRQLNFWQRLCAMRLSV
ncbi:MAG: hypothetical protein AAGJ81_06245 [Verrucomicrobiota bacterium]